jgi:hypothetical protein
MELTRMCVLIVMHTIVDRDAHNDFTNRKGWTSQNVIAECDFDMRFMFIGVGMAGAAHGMFVVRQAQGTPNFPHPPQGLLPNLSSSWITCRTCHACNVLMNLCICVLVCREVLFGGLRVRTSSGIYGDTLQ